MVLGGASGPDCLVDYSYHDLAWNFAGPAASGKVTNALQVPVVAAAQPVTNPVWATSLDVGSLLHGHVAHANHAYSDYPGSDLVVFLHAFLGSSSLGSSMSH